MSAALTPRSPFARFRWMRVHLFRVTTAPAVGAIEATAPGQTRVRVDGMLCVACAARTRAALASVPGVEDVSVDLDAGVAELLHDPASSPDRSALQHALDAVVVARPARRALARLAASIRGAR